MQNIVAWHLVSLIITNDGFTYNPNTDTLNPSHGFMVSKKGTENVSPFIDFDIEVLQNYVSEQNLGKNEFIGAWYNEDDQQVYLDVSELIEDKETAIRKGIDADQLAIFDNYKKEVINLPTPQKSGTDYQNKSYLEMKIRELL